MPRGGVRPGAGRKRKPIAEHRLAGTWRRHRHGEPPTTAGNLAVMPQSRGWSPTPADRAGLGERATDWLETTVSDYVLSELEGRRLIAALRSLNRIDQLEQAQ